MAMPGQVVARAAPDQVAPLGQAVVQQAGHQRAVAAPFLLFPGNVRGQDVEPGQVLDLGHVGLPQIVKGREMARVARGQADLPPGDQRAPVVERQFQRLGHVDVPPGGHALLLAGDAGLDAADDAIADRVLGRDAVRDQGGQDDLVAEEGRHAQALGDGAVHARPRRPGRCWDASAPRARAG